MDIDAQIKAVRQSMRDLDHEINRMSPKDDLISGALMDEMKDQRTQLAKVIETLSAVRTVQGVFNMLELQKRGIGKGGIGGGSMELEYMHGDEGRAFMARGHVDKS